MQPRSGGPPPLRRLIVPGLFVAALFAVVILRQPGAPELREAVLTGTTMGTTYTVKVVAAGGDDAAADRLEAVIDTVLSRVNDSMSTYVGSSEVVAFNRRGAGAFEASDDLLEVVAEAQRIARLTDGAFDITVGPLVDAWGFGPQGAVDPPPDEVISELLSTTGFERISVARESGVLTKDSAEVEIDLSAIAKGFAVDRLSRTLVEGGRANFMVEVGGEVRTSGRNAEERVWRIGVERPDEGGRSVHTVIPLADLALATSGDYRNFIVSDGVRHSHTIDPRTGRPIAHELASVSVIHASCMTADALATALEVLGPDGGMAFAESHGIPALFLVRLEDGRFEDRRSSEWTALLENVPAGDRVDQSGS